MAFWHRAWKFKGFLPLFIPGTTPVYEHLHICSLWFRWEDSFWTTVSHELHAEQKKNVTIQKRKMGERFAIFTTFQDAHNQKTGYSLKHFTIWVILNYYINWYILWREGLFPSARSRQLGRSFIGDVERSLVLKLSCCDLRLCDHD
jgi:hypothetical protein